MKTLHLDPNTRNQTARVAEEIDRLLSEGKSITVTVAEEQELLSPQQAAERLGFSRQHVVRLINAGEIKARKLPSSSYWQIPLVSMLDFEQRREHAREQSDAFSRELDQLGAPLE
ncbi:MAG TPA: helix-turn-helix domain-containing protein [Solirubrobacteraceae bacterium]|nr:helix-turn-helix domain-containing protein [Solirubrobacteraceae bacterium]